MRTMMLTLALLMTGLGRLPSAWSDDALEVAAKAHYQQGQQLLDAGRYLEARAQFSAGYDLSKRPAFLFNMAECSRLAGEVSEAERSYHAYLTAEPGGPLTSLAEQRLAELRLVARPEAKPAAEPAGKPPAPKLTLPASAAVRSSVVEKPSTAIGGLDRPVGDRPLWKKWPFWALVGGVVVAGAATAYLVTTHETSPDIDWRSP